MIRAVVVDDEKKSRDVLLRLIEEANLGVVVLDQANSVEKGVQVIKEEKPQLVFLDVEMLDGTGFNLLEEFDKVDFKIIFTTAYDHYAIKAFKYSAIDYLLKPINIDELQGAITRAEKSIASKVSINSQIDVLIDNIKTRDVNKKIAIKSADRIDFVEVDEIVYCESGSSYTTIVLTNNRKITAAKPLKYFDAMFSDDFNFFRVSRTHLINPNYISAYKKNSDSVELGKGILIEVSRRRKKEFLETLES